MGWGEANQPIQIPHTCAGLMWCCMNPPWVNSANLGTAHWRGTRAGWRRARRWWRTTHGCCVSISTSASCGSRTPTTWWWCVFTLTPLLHPLRGFLIDPSSNLPRITPKSASKDPFLGVGSLTQVGSNPLGADEDADKLVKSVKQVSEFNKVAPLRDLLKKVRAPPKKRRGLPQE
jgi:hypothetical protein